MENRGGARTGSGRKRYNLSEKSLADLERSFRVVAKEKDTTAGEQLAKLAFGSDNERIRLKALEIYYNVAVAKKVENTIDDKRKEPTIYLPECKDNDSAIATEENTVVH